MHLDYQAPSRSGLAQVWLCTYRKVGAWEVDGWTSASSFQSAVYWWSAKARSFVVVAHYLKIHLLKFFFYSLKLPCCICSTPLSVLSIMPLECHLKLECPIIAAILSSKADRLGGLCPPCLFSFCWSEILLFASNLISKQIFFYLSNCPNFWWNHIKSLRYRIPQ